MFPENMGIFLKPLLPDAAVKKNPIGEYFHIPGTQRNEQCQSCQTKYDLTRSHVAMRRRKKTPMGKSQAEQILMGKHCKDSSSVNRAGCVHIHPSDMYSASLMVCVCIGGSESPSSLLLV